MVEVGGLPVKTFAEQKGLSPSNAGVRVFRAREALKKRLIESRGTCAEHGCVNCTCRRHKETAAPVVHRRPGRFDQIRQAHHTLSRPGFLEVSAMAFAPPFEDSPSRRTSHHPSAGSARCSSESP